MPFCHKCGNRVIDTAKFCNKCGTKIRQRVSAQHSTPSLTRPEKVKPSFNHALKKKTSTQKTEVNKRISSKLNFNEFQVVENEWIGFLIKTVMLQRLTSYVSYIEEIKNKTNKKLRETRSKRYQLKKANSKLDNEISFKSLYSALKGKKRGESNPKLEFIIMNEWINSLDEEYNLLDDSLDQANQQAEKFKRDILSDQSEEKIMKFEKLILGSTEFSTFRNSFTKLKDYRKREAVLINDVEDVLAAISEAEDIIEQLNNLSELVSNCARSASMYSHSDGSVQTLLEKEEILNTQREMIQIKIATHRIHAYLHSLSTNSTIDLSFLNMDKALESFLEDLLSKRGIRLKSESEELVLEISASLIEILDKKELVDNEIASIKIDTNTILEQLKSLSQSPDEVIDAQPVDEPETPAIVEVTEVVEEASVANLSSDLDIEKSISQQLKYSSRKIEKIGNEIHVTLMSGDIKNQLWTLKEKTIEISGEGTTYKSDISFKIISKNREGTFNWSDPWKNIELIVDKSSLSKLKRRRLIAEQIYKTEGNVEIVFSRSSKVVNILIKVAKTSANVKTASQTFKEMVYLASSI